jgi:hypothetical protein
VQQNCGVLHPASTTFANTIPHVETRAASPCRTCSSLRFNTVSITGGVDNCLNCDFNMISMINMITGQHNIDDNSDNQNHKHHINHTNHNSDKNRRHVGSSRWYVGVCEEYSRCQSFSIELRFTNNIKTNYYEY